MFFFWFLVFFSILFSFQYFRFKILYFLLILFLPRKQFCFCMDLTTIIITRIQFINKIYLSQIRLISLSKLLLSIISYYLIKLLGLYCTSFASSVLYVWCFTCLVVLVKIIFRENERCEFVRPRLFRDDSEEANCHSALSEIKSLESEHQA